MKYLKSYKLFEFHTPIELSDVPPKGLEEQIAFSMKWYPTLYDSKYGRIKVLAHMYLSSEYEWVDGELINIYGLNTDKEVYKYRCQQYDMARPEKVDYIKRLYDHWEELVNIIGNEDSHILKRIQDEIEDLQDELDNFDPYGKEYPNEKPYVFDSRKISTFSPIFHIPENVKSDYLEGAKEILNYIISNGCRDEKIIEVAKEVKYLQFFR